MKRLLLFVFLLLPSLCWATGGAPPVQSKMGGGTGTSLSDAFPGAVTAGNTLYIAVGQADAAFTITGPSDACGDTFTEAANSPVTGTGNRIRIYTTLTNGGCATIVITSSSSAGFITFFAEYNNMATSTVVDCTSSGTGNSTSLATGNCVTGTAVDTLVSFGFQPVNTATFTAGASYTIEQQTGGSNSNSGAGEDQNVTSTGTYTGTLTTNTTGQWAIHVLALKNATQAASGSGAGIGGKGGMGGKAGF